MLRDVQNWDVYDRFSPDFPPRTNKISNFDFLPKIPAPFKKKPISFRQLIILLFFYVISEMQLPRSSGWHWHDLSLWRACYGHYDSPAFAISGGASICRNQFALGLQY